MKTALLAGATGLVGNYLLDELLNSEHYEQVKILVRRPLNKSHPKLQEHIIDFDNLQEVPKQKLSAEHIYIALGTTIKKAGSKEQFQKVDLEYVDELAELSSEYGAKKIAVVSAVGADAKSSVFYSKVKGLMEKKISEKPFECTCIIRPSFLEGPREEFRLGEKIGGVFLSLFQPFMIGKLKKYRSVHAQTVALAMKKALALEKQGLHYIEGEEIKNLAKP